jgi:hypothetical protein
LVFIAECAKSTVAARFAAAVGCAFDFGFAEGRGRGGPVKKVAHQRLAKRLARVGA